MTRYYERYESPPRRRRGFWSTVMRLALIALVLVLLVSGGLWLLGLALSLVTSVLILALLAAPFLFIVWVGWMIWRIVFGR